MMAAQMKHTDLVAAARLQGEDSMVAMPQPFNTPISLQERLQMHVFGSTPACGCVHVQNNTRGPPQSYTQGGMGRQA
jgi:hypothetical protein